MPNDISADKNLSAQKIETVDQLNSNNALNTLNITPLSAPLSNLTS